MTKYILHGGYMKVKNALNKKFFREVIKDLKEGEKVLIVCFAREQGEDKEVFEREKRSILESAKGKFLTISMASKNNFNKQLKESGAILLHGGDTERLLEILRRYPDFSKIIKGKVVAGSSAGACVLSNYFYSDSKNNIFEGLGILPIRIICHYNGDKKIIIKMNNYPKELELVVLKDYEYRIFEK